MGESKKRAINTRKNNTIRLWWWW